MFLGATRSSSEQFGVLGVQKLGVPSFLDFQGAWYSLFEALFGSEQLGVARNSSEFLGAPQLGFGVLGVQTTGSIKLPAISRELDTPYSKLCLAQSSSE